MTSSLKFRKFRGTSTSSSSANQWTYDVFLSFGGQDTRKNFTGHLYDALERDGLKTFIDDEQLRRGEEISSELLKAIEESRISVVVLSENYASSAWCLEELTKIFECVEKKKHVVLPVFDGVSPSEVRNQRNNIKKSFGKLEERFRDNPEKVERWKAVLRQVGNISGWHLHGDSSHESLVVGEIVREIAPHIDFQVAKHPDEIKSPVKEPHLHLWHNDITKAITEFRSFSKLHTLNLSSTFFNGELHPSLGDLSSLKRMTLFNDSLTGVFPIRLANLTQFIFQDEALPVRNFIQFITDYMNLQVAKHPVRIESHVEEPYLSNSPCPIRTEPLAIEYFVQEIDSSPSSPVIESLAQEPLLSSLPSGNGAQGNNPSTLSQGVILIFIGLVIGLLQLGNLFETHPINMWITVAASVMCFLSHAAMTKINGRTHWTKYSQTINIFRILSGILAAVSLLSTRLPHQRWCLVFAIWALLSSIIVTGIIVFATGAKRRSPLSQDGV